MPPEVVDLRTSFGRPISGIVAFRVRNTFLSKGDFVRSARAYANLVAPKITVSGLHQHGRYLTVQFVYTDPGTGGCGFFALGGRHIKALPKVLCGVAKQSG